MNNVRRVLLLSSTRRRSCIRIRTRKIVTHVQHTHFTISVLLSPEWHTEKTEIRQHLTKSFSQLTYKKYFKRTLNNSRFCDTYLYFRSYNFLGWTDSKVLSSHNDCWFSTKRSHQSGHMHEYIPCRRAFGRRQ